MKTEKKLFNRRKDRLRAKIRKTSNGRFRLSVFRSEKHIYAQIIDDSTRVTLVSASSLEKDLRTNKYANIGLAGKIGKIVAQRALEKGVKDVVFDRGGYAYHGKIKALAESAREVGLNF